MIKAIGPLLLLLLLLLPDISAADSERTVASARCQKSESNAQQHYATSATSVSLSADELSPTQ